MSFLRHATMGDSEDRYSVMYDDLSADAQEKLSSIMTGDTLWMMLPLAQLYQDKYTLTQDELDDAALLTAGYYR